MNYNWLYTYGFFVGLSAGFIIPKNWVLGLTIIVFGGILVVLIDYNFVNPYYSKDENEVNK